MKKPEGGIIHKTVDKITGKTVLRIAYFILIAALAFYGFSDPDATVKILKALSEALSFLL